jgi:hypothetical protein
MPRLAPVTIAFLWVLLFTACSRSLPDGMPRILADPTSRLCLETAMAYIQLQRRDIEGRMSNARSKNPMLGSSAGKAVIA